MILQIRVMRCHCLQFEGKYQIHDNVGKEQSSVNFESSIYIFEVRGTWSKLRWELDVIV